MQGQVDLLTAIDAFVRVRKRLVGADGPCEWGVGHNRYEVKTSFPLEVNGELLPSARMEVIGLPQAEGSQFRLTLCFNAAVCRLDFTDEIHPNTDRILEDGVPPSVNGPHFHSWSKNRRFFKGMFKAPELRNAEMFTPRGSFDSNLRWFCQEVNIDQPDGRHVIELPRREGLF